MTATIMTLIGCAHTKASIDYSYFEGIIWPGGGQPPRIQYLWSLSNVRGGTDSELIDILTGEETEGSQEERDLNILQRPQSVFVSDAGVLYITDPGARRVNVINLSSMDSFQIDAFNEIPFSEPIGVVALPDGRIIISDASLRLVGFFGASGDFEKFINGQFKRPTAIAFDPASGMIYITDTWAHTIYKYDLDGNLIGNIGAYGEGPGQFQYPTHIFVDSRGYIYVSDTLNFRVQVLTPDGEQISSFGLPGDMYSHFDKIKGIAVDSEGHIYVADSMMNMVQVFDIQGRLLLFFGSKGSFYGQFLLPTGIFIDKADRIFVADALNGRIQAFKFLGGDKE